MILDKALSHRMWRIWFSLSRSSFARIAKALSDPNYLLIKETGPRVIHTSWLTRGIELSLCLWLSAKHTYTWQGRSYQTLWSALPFISSLYASFSFLRCQIAIRSSHRSACPRAMPAQSNHNDAHYCSTLPQFTFIYLYFLTDRSKHWKSFNVSIVYDQCPKLQIVVVKWLRRRLLNSLW